MSDLTDNAVQRAISILQQHLTDPGAGVQSPTLATLWPVYYETEAKYLRSAARSEWAWHELRGRRGEDGIELQEHHALKVTSEIVEGIRAQLRSTTSRRGRVYSAATVNRHLIVLRRLLHWAHETQRIPYNPLASLTMEEENNVKRTKIRTEAEIEQLLAGCNRLIRALVLVLFDGGLRKSEALNLRRDQVFKKPTGGAVIELGSEETKNKRPRQPHITQRAVDALEAIPSGGAYYFAKPSGQRYSPRYIYSLFQRAVERSGLRGDRGENITLHTLRHSFAYVRRVRDHWPESLVMDQGGWLTDSVLRRYGVTDQEERTRAMEAVEARISRERELMPNRRCVVLDKQISVDPTSQSSDP